MKRALLAAALWACCGAALANEPVRVGLVVTLSGPAGSLGQHVRDGFLLGLKQSGGKFGGREVQLTVIDDQRDAASVAGKVQAYIKNGQPSVIVGPLFAPLLLPTLKTATEGKVVVMSPRAAPASLAGKRCQPNFFSLAPQDDESIEVLAKYAEDRNLTRAIIISSKGEEADIAATAFTRAFKGEVADRIVIAPDATEFADLSNRIDILRPQAVFLHVDGAVSGPLLKFLKQSGASSGLTLLGSSGFDEADLAAHEGASVGVYSASDWSFGIKTPASDAFLQAFEAEFGYAPGAVAMRAYDAARLIDAAKQALRDNGNDQATLVDALKQVEIDSPRGKFSFGNNNFPIEDLYLTRIEADAAGRVRNVVQKQMFAQYGDHYAADCPLK